MQRQLRAAAESATATTLTWTWTPSESHPVRESSNCVGSEIALALPINMHMVDDEDGDRERATDLSIHYRRRIRMSE